MFEQTFKNIDDALWKEAALRVPQEILHEIAALDAENAEIFTGILGML